MILKDLRAYEVDLTPHPATQPRISPTATAAFRRPIDRYPEAAEAETGWKRVVCIATAADGTWGLGMTINGGPVAQIINDHLRPLLVGQPCTATSRIWDIVARATSPYGGIVGLTSYAMSAVDVALWDLKGKLLGVPVYELLGGPQKDRIFCYASNTRLEYGIEESLRWFLELGFGAVKIFLTEGPDDRLEGLNRTVDRVATAREIVGDDVELAVDGWLNSDIEYAVRLGQALEPFRIKWLEDYLPPAEMEGYRKVRRRLPNLPLASGEHWYGTATFTTAAAEGLVDILQPDVLWCGGVTNTVRICELAACHGLSVIVHAGMNTPFGQHITFAMPAAVWGERSEGVSPPGVPLEEMVLLPGTPVIRDGFLVPSDAPGFGIEVTTDWLDERRS